MATAALTGTLVDSQCHEGHIVSGGKTIIATLTGDTWVPATAEIVYVGGHSRICNW